MSFFSQLKDEVNDRNIDKSKIHPVSDEPEEAEAQPEPVKEPETDPEYPEHPDYIALKPNFTERQLWRMPAIRFYMAIIGFCAGMVVFGVINQVFALGMTKGAVGWYQLFGAAIGFMFSREYLEPHWKIPFSQGTPEQKKAAAEAYVAEINALDEHIHELRKMRGIEDDEEENSADS
ncbi:hypothetical protein [Butyricicoccus sp.]|uniref:hypothetical protein n=1 Tax=Butyricicoccus sp. TaxID=2049021 RepID=UPI003F153D6B